VTSAADHANRLRVGECRCRFLRTGMRRAVGVVCVVFHVWLSCRDQRGRWSHITRLTRLTPARACQKRAHMCARPPPPPPFPVVPYNACDSGVLPDTHHALPCATYGTPAWVVKCQATWRLSFSDHPFPCRYGSCRFQITLFHADTVGGYNILCQGQATSF